MENCLGLFSGAAPLQNSGPVVDPRGREARSPLLGLISFNFTRYLAKLLPNNKLVPPFEVDAPLGNPGSATLDPLLMYVPILQ